MKKRRFPAIALAVTLLLSGCTTSEPIVEKQPEKEKPSPVTEIAAVDDFYGYVNLKKLDTLEIGFQQSSVGSFNEATDFQDEKIKEMLMEIFQSDQSFPKGSNEQLLHDLYHLYLNEDHPSEDAEAFFAEMFRKIDAVSSIQDYASLMATMYRDYGISLILTSNVHYDLLQPDRYATILYPDYDIFMGTNLKNLIEQRNTSSFLFAQSVLRSRGLSNVNHPNGNAYS